MVSVIENGPERGAEKALGELTQRVGVPVRTLVAGATRGQHLDGPLDEWAAGGPAVGLEGREGDSAPLYSVADPGAGVGRGEVCPCRVLVVADVPHGLDQRVQRFWDCEGVLDQRAHVVVDVDHDRQRGTIG